MPDLKILVVSLSLLCLAPTWGQVDLETQRQMIEDFQREQEAKKAREKRVEVSDEPTKEGDLILLRQELADARLAYESKKNNETRAAVGQATINYAVPLIHLRDYDTATEAIETSIKMVGGQGNLSRLLVEVFLEQSRIAVERGDYYTGVRLLHEAWSEAKASRIQDLAASTAQEYRDFYFDWAQLLYDRAEWPDATSKASEALAWKIDTGPIDSLLAQIHYIRDQYNLAGEHLTSAMRELGRSNASLVYLADLIKTESYLERNFRTADSKNFILRSEANFSIDEKNLQAAFAKAREEAEAIFGMTTSRKIRVSVYQRSDYIRFCEAADWSQVCSIGGKIRLRADAARGRAGDLEVMLKYAYGLWVMDVETNGLAPAWFAEGFAHQLAFPGGPPNGGRNEIQKDLAAGRLPTFEQIIGPFRFILDLRDAAMAMAQSQSGFRFLIEKEGFGVVRDLVEGMKAGHPMEVALPSRTGFDYNSFFEEWKRSFEQGFLTEAFVDEPRLRALGRISPLGSYWER